MIGGQALMEADLMQSKRIKHINQVIEAYIKKEERKDVTLIDIGCGEGDIIRHMLNGGQIAHFIGIDMDEKELEKAKN